MLYMICYDIFDDRRRWHVTRLLEGSGERVQDSVFECHLDKQRLRHLKEALAKVIVPTVDKVAYYPLCAKDTGDVRVIGKGRAPKDITCWVC